MTKNHNSIISSISLRIDAKKIVKRYEITWYWWPMNISVSRNKSIVNFLFNNCLICQVSPPFSLNYISPKLLLFNSAQHFRYHLMIVINEHVGFLKTQQPSQYFFVKDRYIYFLFILPLNHFGKIFQQFATDELLCWSKIYQVNCS